MAETTSYVNARNHLVGACMVVFYNIIYGFIIPIVLILIIHSKGGLDAEVWTEFEEIIFPAFVVITMVNTVMIFIFSFREKIGLINAFVRWFWTLIVGRFITLFLILCIVLYTEPETNIIKSVSAVGWVIFVLVIPIVQSLRLSKLVKRYKSSLQNKEQEKWAQVQRDRCKYTRYSAGNRFSKGDYSPYSSRSHEDEYESYKRNMYIIEQDERNRRECEDEYRRNCDYWRQDEQYYSYESYKESESYYSSDDSYRIYESYYNS